MEATPLPKPLPSLLKEFLVPLAPDEVTVSVIQAAADEKTRAQDMTPLLLADSGYQRYLLAQSFLAERLAAWQAETGDAPQNPSVLVERVLGLLGKVPVRNIVACARVERVSGAPQQPVKPEDKVSLVPSQVISHALNAESVCQDNGWIYPERAFAAGLHYDWLAVLIKKRNGSPEEKKALAAAYKEGLATAKMAYQLGQTLKTIHMGKSLFAAGLLLPIGKALMACFFPSSSDRSWAGFAKEAEQAGDHAFDHYLFLEHRRFPVTHAELSGLIVSFGALLRETEKAVASYPYPESLKRISPDLHQLASILSVASRMARFGGPRPPWEPFHERWFQANGISADELKRAYAAAHKAKG